MEAMLWWGGDGGGAQEGTEGQDENREIDGVLQGYQGWGDEADRWLGEEEVAGWRLTGNALHQRVSSVRMVSSMWLTEGVVARRADHLTDAERTVMSKCALSGEEATGRGMSTCCLSALHISTPSLYLSKGRH